MRRSPRHHPGPSSRASALAALALLASVVAVIRPAAVAPAQEPGPVAMSVTPDEGIRDGQPVAMSATGLTPGESYVVTTCLSSGSCANDYTLFPRNTTITARNVAEARADASGSISVTIRERTEWEVPPMAEWDSFVPVSCIGRPCLIAIFRGTRGAFIGQPVARTPVSFERFVYEGTASLGSVSVPEFGRVRITASGLSPYALVARVEVCPGADASGERSCWPWAGHSDSYVSVGPDGTVDSVVEVSRRLQQSEGWVDCAISPCRIRLMQYNSSASEVVGRTPPVPLRFGPEWSPWPTAAAFVARPLAVVRGRPLSSREAAPVMALLRDHSISGVDALLQTARTAGEDTRSATWVIAEAVRRTLAVFGRSPTAAEVEHWRAAVRRGMTPRAIADAFGRAAEARAAWEDPVVSVYRRTLQRDPRGDEWWYWHGRLEGGLTVSGLVDAVVRSGEARRLLAPRTATTIITWVLAGRLPTDAEVDEFSTELGQGGTAYSAVRKMLVSGEVGPWRT